MNQVHIKTTIAAALAASALAILPASQLLAQEQGPILSLYEVSVKHGHDSQWREGAKAWNKCYADNGGKQAWGAWRRVQGEGSVYVFSALSDNWAAVGSRDPAARACEKTFETMLAPHELGDAYSMARLMPAVSNDYQEGENVVDVYSFKVNDAKVFNQVIADVSKAMQKTDNTASIQWYEVRGGGPDAADYFVVAQHANFASLDQDRTGPWEAVEQQHGKETADKWRAMFAASLDDGWNYLYSRVEDLGYQPAAE